MPDYSMLCAAASGEEYLANIMARKFNGVGNSTIASDAPSAEIASPKGPAKDFGL